MFQLPFGATPLTPEEMDELIPTHISTKEELNEFEQKNILEARIWLHALPHLPNVLDGQFLKKLHRRMFNQTWKWAGHYRKTEKNIGIAHLQEMIFLKHLYFSQLIFRKTKECYSSLH